MVGGREDDDVLIGNGERAAVGLGLFDECDALKVEREAVEGCAVFGGEAFEAFKRGGRVGLKGCEDAFDGVGGVENSGAAAGGLFVRACVGGGVCS